MKVTSPNRTYITFKRFKHNLIIDIQIHFESSQSSSLSLLRPKTETKMSVSFIFIMGRRHNKRNLAKPKLS